MGEPLKEILGGVQSVRDEESRRVQAEEAEKIKELIELQATIIAGGEGVGNPFHNGIIALYGDELIADPKIFERYETAAARMAGRKGQPAAIFYREIEDLEHIDFGSSSRRPKQGVKQSMVFGVLGTDEIGFDYDDGEARIVFENLVHGEGIHISKPEAGHLVIDEPQRYGLFGNLNLGRQLDKLLDLSTANLRLSMYDNRTYNQMDFLVGYEAIQEWLASVGEGSSALNGELGDMRRACDALKIERVQAATRMQQHYLHL